MGLGGTAKKLQKVVDMADDLYAKISDLREELVSVRDRIDETNDRVSGVEKQLAEQRVILERLAEAEGVDTSVERLDEDGQEPAASATSESQGSGGADSSGQG